MADFVKIGTKAELPADGEAKEFEVNGTTICIAQVDGSYAAMENMCCHRGGPLGQGVVLDGKVICPWHGWGFDPKTGASDQDISMGVKVYPIKIEGDDVLVELP
ncbi:MAG TPA: Rieske (2Fe-2S) protein [Terriglobales bacterium]|jgi:nitrite reductase (NADH) small subunit|nr:Rieske (2Fe-2S) protein [Terriglobales bacterium]